MSSRHADGTPLVSLDPYRAQILARVADRILPPFDGHPGATEAGVVTYIDRALGGHDHEQLDEYRLGLDHLARAASELFDCEIVAASDDQIDELIERLERNELPGQIHPPQRRFFARLRAHVQEGMFADPVHGGNAGTAGWRFLGHPGVWLDHSAEENLSSEPVDRGGEIRTAADAGYRMTAVPAPAQIPGFDPQAGARPPADDADVVIVGMGAMGGMVAPLLTAAGLRVVGFEAGGWRQRRDYRPDELEAAYYARAGMGAKFTSESPRWRRNDGDPTQPMTYSLGRMMNGVGGTIVHWGGALRRFHPHQLRFLSHVVDRYGEDALPDGSTLVDWPLSYSDLEPYYEIAEHLAGVAGNTDNPFVPRRSDYPMPPLRPFRKGQLFADATSRLRYHPYPTPACVNSEPYNGLPSLRYHAWAAAFGAFDDERWNPGLTSVPEALESGLLDLRTQCRVIRVLTDADGVTGVEYVDARGDVQVQRARTVILSSYTFENLRLMFLSADDRHRAGLGNSGGQLGRHFMVKQWGDVYGIVPGATFNAHTGPASQMVTMDDLTAESFDSSAGGFIGGASLSMENQVLPLQIARDPLPDDVRPWGRPYQEHLRRWQDITAVRIQPETLPYASDFVDLDPVHRDRSGLGLPVLRVTTDMRANEHRLRDFMDERARDILREMGATKTWSSGRLTGVGSSHDLGGARMGEDPRTSVVSPDLEVHDTTGLFVLSGATFPTCPGVNPHLTMMALGLRAMERLTARIGGS
ncbi:GMC family oxidoreductase [Agrococcus sp. KRD186]|uniref:GMC family oxidoreductase n=1 Tax=Agrococcus sp. KRD186 TaxID=2729730 RepID=UPI0019D01338|nr:GMC family oxidoreductase [Agrococcus sp. KRD186]